GADRLATRNGRQGLEHPRRHRGREPADGAVREQDVRDDRLRQGEEATAPVEAGELPSLAQVGRPAGGQPSDRRPAPARPPPGPRRSPPPRPTPPRPPASSPRRR